METSGQLEPVLANRDGERFVLLDGYHRVAALKKCGQDKVWVEWISCDPARGLVTALLRNQGRKWEPLEEAMLIRKLIEEHGMSQQKAGLELGKSGGISGRLKLLEGLPDAVLEAVREGGIGVWAAQRVFAPLARANSEHAVRDTSPEKDSDEQPRIGGLSQAIQVIGETRTGEADCRSGPGIKDLTSST